MAKKSMVEREKRRKKLAEKYAARRNQILEELKNLELSQEDRFTLQAQIQEIPRNAAPSRQHNRCWLTGRPHGYIRDFGLSRIAFREMAHQGLLPGVVKSSW
jgi:small subunit ribosomal protein S14